MAGSPPGPPAAIDLATIEDSIHQCSSTGSDLAQARRRKHLSNGDWDRVVELGEEGLAICTESGEVLRRGYFLMTLSEAHWQRGEREMAEAYEAEALASKHALGDLSGIGTVVETLAWMAAERGAEERAAILLGCAQHGREVLDREIIGPLRSQHERSEASTRARLGDTAFSAAFHRGRSMTTDEAVAYALGRKSAAKSTRPAPAQREVMPLTRRELEIARLVAEGLNTRELASRLVISERTVESHVANILNKLGLGSRIQLTRWVAGLSKQ